MSFEEKERMARFKIEEIKELEMDLRELEWQLKLELKFIRLMLKILRLDFENE